MKQRRLPGKAEPASRDKAKPASRDKAKPASRDKAKPASRRKAEPASRGLAGSAAPDRGPARSSGKNSASARIPLWRWLAILLSLAGFLVFFFPVMGRILNPANLAAMGGFLVLAVIFLRWPAFLALLRRIWAKGWGKLLLSITALALAFLLVLMLVLCCEVVSCLGAYPEGPCPTVIVLGCQVRGTTPSLMLSYRIQAAADYLDKNPDAVAILSGGQGPGERISEAGCMYNGLVARGIDPARLILEENSANTRENLRFSEAIMEEKGMSGPVAIVSNDFHIFRALKMAKDNGLEAEGLAACSDYWFSRPTYVLREALALVKYAVTN